ILSSSERSTNHLPPSLVLILCVLVRFSLLFLLFFFNHPAPTEIYTLSLHDALPISTHSSSRAVRWTPPSRATSSITWNATSPDRSEEHTSELQSRGHLVCRLLLEKKKRIYGVDARAVDDSQVQTRTSRPGHIEDATR